MDEAEATATVKICADCDEPFIAFRPLQVRCAPCVLRRLEES
jgi:hypothetical protein